MNVSAQSRLEIAAFIAQLDAAKAKNLNEISTYVLYQYFVKQKHKICAFLS